MINWQRVNELRDEVGAEDFQEVVDLFLEEVEEVTNRLATNPEPETLMSDLHFLKGSALSLGFVAFSDICEKGEVASARGAADTVDVPEILTTYQTSKQVFLADLPSALAG